MHISNGNRVLPSDAVVTRSVNGSTVLLNTDTGRYFTLDEIGGRAWAVLISSPTIQAAYDQLLAEYEVEPSELRADLETLIANLEAQGLVEVGRA